MSASAAPDPDVPGTPAAGRPRRRRPGEARALLLASAAELFAVHGYTRTSTRAIAQHAGVAEVLIFRHFGGKAALFREAVHAPMLDAVRMFVAEWSRADADPSPERVVEAFVGTLYDMLDARRGSMTALMGAQAYTEEIRTLLAGQGDPITELFEELEGVVLRYASMSGFTGLNPPLSARVAVGMVVGRVVFGEWLGGAPDHTARDRDVRDRDVRELSTLLLHGTRRDG